MTKTDGKLNATAISRCHGFGHRWDDPPAPPNLRPPQPGYAKLYFRCSRCGTEKIFSLWLATGEGRGYYRYPREYSNLKNTQREWKLAFFRQYRKNQTYV